MTPILMTATGLEVATSGTAATLTTGLDTTRPPGEALYQVGCDQAMWLAQGIADTPIIANATADTLTATAHGLGTGQPVQIAALGDTAITQAWRVQAAGPTFVDITAGINSAGANDAQPFPAGEVLNDYCAIGYTSTFGALKVNLGTAGTVGTLAWEYWNGTAWVALSGVTDGTTGFTLSATHSVTFTTPSDWAPRVLNGSASLYYIRARVLTAYTVDPIITQAWVDGTLPTGVSGATTYWVIVVDVNTFKLSTSRASALAGTGVVDITAPGGGNVATTVATAGPGSTFLPAGVLALLDGHLGAKVSVLQDTVAGKASLTQVLPVR